MCYTAATIINGIKYYARKGNTTRVHFATRRAYYSKLDDRIEFAKAYKRIHPTEDVYVKGWFNKSCIFHLEVTQDYLKEVL